VEVRALKDSPLALRKWSLNGGVVKIQLTRVADFPDVDALNRAIYAFTRALTGPEDQSHEADLLEALDWLLASITADPANERYPGDKEDRLLLACAAARTAIAKATGEQP